MLRDDEAIQRATDQMTRLSAAPDTLSAAHEYDALLGHTIPEIEAFDPVLADAIRNGVARLVKARAARGLVPSI